MGIFYFVSVVDGKLWNFFRAPVPLKIFRSGLKCTLPITTEFCTRHDSVTVVTCANFVMIGWIRYDQDNYKFSSNFEFDRNIVSRMGAWYDYLFILRSPRWRHQMKAFCRVTSPVTGDFPHKGPVTRTLMFLWCGSAQTVKQTAKWSVIWDYPTFMWRHRNAILWMALRIKLPGHR